MRSRVATVLVSIAFVGCTSILGSFDVATGPAGDDGGGGGDTAPTCTECNGQCVDLQTNTLNCGACGIACLGGQVCTAGKCACAPDEAFCNGACQHADRQHCGSSCAQCQTDEICTGGCKIAPPASFDKTPLDPTGWKDGANNRIQFKIHDIGPGTTYECRSGPKTTFNATTPAFAPCDGASGTGLVYEPSEDATTPEGSYRTEMRYRNDTFKSDPVGYDFYVHHHLDGVASCPRTPTDDPHFADADYFKAAEDFALVHGEFVIDSAFPMLGTSSADSFYLTNPFINIPFTGAYVQPHEVADGQTWGAPPFQNVQIKELMLRHKFVVNGTRTLILVRRLYENPKKHDCKNTFRIGTRYSARVGPDGVGRGEKYIDCEALVMNVHGVGLCMGLDSTGKKPAPQLTDTKADPGGFVASWTVSGSGTSVTGSGPSINMINMGYLQIPARTGHWYKTSSTSATSVTLTTSLPASVPAGTPFRYAGTMLTQTFVIPAGYAKLIQGQHLYTPPSHGTKCVTLGCDVGRPWLTYLPP